MPDLSTPNLMYSVSGLVVGMLVGLTGVGGGSLMTPLLVLLFGIHPATAVGTDLLYASITKGVGTAVHGINRTVDWRIVRRLASGSVPVTALTLLAVAHFGKDHHAAPSMVNMALGIALILSAVSILFKSALVKRFSRGTDIANDRSIAVLTVLTGALLGLVVTLTSVGAGAIGMTVLLILYPRTPTTQVVGADVAHAVPLTLIAGLGHWLSGSVDTTLLLFLLIGSIPGVIIGSLLTVRVPDAVLRFAIAIVLIIVGAKLVS